MAELTFKSPGVSSREIDLSGPTKAKPRGIPAGVVGTSLKGRAFVPILFPTYQDFVAEFGASDGEKFGPLAINEWMKNAKAGVFLKLLGAGDGKKRTNDGTNMGRVNNAGFVVGNQRVQANGKVEDNPNAYAGQEAAVQATGELISCDGQTATSADTAFTIFVPANAGGAATATKIILDDSETTDPAGEGDGIIAIGTGDKNDAQIAALIVKAIAGTADDNIDFATAGDGQTGVGIAGISGEVTDTNKVTITVTQPGAKGNKVVAARVSGLAGIVAAASPSGGEEGHTGHRGRTYFLGSFMAEAHTSDDGTTVNEYSTIFTDAQIGMNGSNKALARVKSHPIIRGVLMAPSGVLLSLSSTYASDNDIRTNVPPAGVYTSSIGDGDAGSSVGSVNVSGNDNQFVMLLNGFSNISEYSNVLTASFNPDSPSYFPKILNTDPTLLETRGHYLYTYYDVYPSHADVTGSGVMTAGSEVTNPSGKILHDVAFLLTGSKAHNTGLALTAGTTAGIPNFENFEDRFRTAFSPFIISQEFGGKNKNLFRIHALDDGSFANDLFKVTIENIQSSNNKNEQYGSFDLLVRDFYDNDNNPRVFETWRKLSLNPDSDRYIEKVIGNQHVYFDFDQNKNAQKVVLDGGFANKSAYIRVEVDDIVKEKEVEPNALPVGFRGHWHLVTSGSGIMEGCPSTAGATIKDLRNAVQPPVPFRENIAVRTGDKKRVNNKLTWGVQFEVNDSRTEPNKSELIRTDMKSWTKYFPRFHTDFQNVVVGDNAGTQDQAGTILDADRFNNNKFTLERVQVVTGSNDKPVFDQWTAAVYRRDGKKVDLSGADGNTHAASDTRFLDVQKDFNHLPTREFLKFTFHLHGGFDGVDIFDEEKAKLTNTAIKREVDDESNQGGIKSGPTVNTYRKSIDILKERSNSDIQLLAIPGVRHKSVTDYAIDAIEERFDALYIMDIESRDELNTVVTGSGDRVHVRHTVNKFEERDLDSSFTAAYFPDVIITDPATNTNVQCPPSVAVLGAFSLNDSKAHPWFAPAGFTRGALDSVLETKVKLSRKNMDALYDADINPLNEFGHTPGVVVFGQKTLKASESALDRVNVRRLLIDIRRKVRKIGERVLFEPNREDTLSRFSAAVGPVLQNIQQQQGLSKFKVQIDTTTTTQHDIENNTIRGKIFLQPTKTVEFVSLDFVVTNAGTVV